MAFPERTTKKASDVADPLLQYALEKVNFLLPSCHLMSLSPQDSGQPWTNFSANLREGAAGQLGFLGAGCCAWLGEGAQVGVCASCRGPREAQGLFREAWSGGHGVCPLDSGVLGSHSRESAIANLRNSEAKYFKQRRVGEALRREF